MSKNQETITLSTMDDIVSYLSDNVSKVSYDVNNMNTQFNEVQNQVNNMQDNVRTLENEIRTFMKEMQQNAIINNAKQTIMMSQMEYDKKYKHRDEVRRRAVGLLQSIDINIIKKSTMDTIGEETIVNNPDYWLAPALVAICHWYGNNKELANSALKKALDRSVEKTSLLLCLIHLRANRLKTAEKWLKQYLALQDPTNMDCKIVLILDALSSGVFNQESADAIINQIESWKEKLKIFPQYEKSQIPKWVEHFKKEQDIPNTNREQFINLFVSEKNEINNVLNFSSNHSKIIKKFKEKLNNFNTEENNKEKKIDKLINMLIFDYEKEELELKNEIDKNNQIINSRDDTQKQKNSYMNADLYTHLSNMCLNNNIFEINKNTQKLAMCLLKNQIIEAYQNAYSINNEHELAYLNIIIDDWIGVTKNGSNEFELKDKLSKHIENKYMPSLNKSKLFSIDMIISVVVFLILSIIFRKNVIVIISLLVVLLTYNIYKLIKHYKAQKLIKEIINKEQENKKEILVCTITEIVDYYFVYEESKDIKEDFIKYLNTLNYSEYIKVYRDNNRNIMIGGKM